MGKRVLAFAVVIVAAFVFLLGGFAFYFHINAPTKDAKYYRQQLTSRGWYGEQRAKKELVANPDKGIPILIEILSAERVGQAEACLSEIGDPAVPALLEALEKNKKNQFRFSVFSVFSFIALKGNASEKNHGIIVRFLANALSDKSLEVRREAALGFSIMGKAGAGALPELKNSLKDVDLGIRLRAANAICAITADRICVIPVLKEALDQDGTFAALGIIGGYGVVTDELVDSMVDLMRRSDDQLRFQVIYTLGSLGEKAKRAAPALELIARDANAPLSMREDASKALASINHPK